MLFFQNFTFQKIVDPFIFPKKGSWNLIKLEVGSQNLVPQEKNNNLKDLEIEPQKLMQQQQIQIVFKTGSQKLRPQ